jgi:hypothetical protein
MLASTGSTRRSPRLLSSFGLCGPALSDAFEALLRRGAEWRGTDRDALVARNLTISQRPPPYHPRHSGNANWVRPEAL